MNSNYKTASVNDFGELTKIADLGLGFQKVRTEYYVRMHSLLGVEGSKIYEGYEFFIHDVKSDKKFMFALTGFGLGYFAEEDTDEMQSIIDEFNEFLFKGVTKLKDCTYQYEHDFGKTTLGCKNGELFEIDE